MVPAHHADQIDDAPFAEGGFRGIERRVAHLFGVQQFRAEIVDRLFVFLHPGGTFSLRDRVGDRGAQARLERRAMVCLPFVLRGPVAGRHDDCELVQLPRNRGIEARGCAELLGEVTRLGAAQQNVERSVGAAARPRQQVLEHRLLCRRHLIVGERPEAVALQTDGARVRACGVGGLR